MQRWQILASIIFLISTSVKAQIIPAEQLFQQAEQHQSAIDKMLFPNTISSNIAPETLNLTEVQTNEPCFPITTLIWKTVEPQIFLPNHYHALQKALHSENIQAHKVGEFQYALSQQHKPEAPCLSAAHIQNIAAKTQNALIEQGYITTRVLIPEQNLKQGTLELSLSIGKIAQFMLNPESTAPLQRATLFNAFPARKGEALQLRDLEQGLENLQRLPTVSAQMEIQPSTLAGYSDVKIDWQQREIPLRLYLTLDDSGSKETGKYLGTISLAWDNPFQLNDIFSISYTHSLKAGVKHTDLQGNTDKSSTDNYAFHYSIPYGYWQLNIGTSAYHYTQIVAGINKNYRYSGKSRQSHLELSRMLYRDKQHKLSANFGLWRKSTHNYIDDSELAVQRRKVGGWSAGIELNSRLNFANLNANLRYKRGTRAFGAIPAPEELFNEGTGKMHIWTGDIEWKIPFSLANQALQWNSHLHAQWNKTPLTAQDKLSIAGRHTVRGFTGEKTLSAEKGWYWRNDLIWQYHNHHQVYLGIDTGHISGASAKFLPSQHLSGATLGFKGQFEHYGQWNYDIFIATPLNNPSGFTTNNAVLGLTFSYGL